ncbi:cupin domain-containing protein [Baekduia soli]|uniref:Cupin domain-containing protein n=1 Tax=Baekduia soli TaxID=496014 RepID=A0A5B8U6Y7_9ACTN|nr:cupin domain-containing protein [Baekduia soli]QEC48760.1 cupin domain-containing protein [Baekduia soli]
MNDATLDIVARNVRSARVAAGWSLDVLARRANVSKGALVALEGARGNPNLATLVGLADALGRSVSSLMEDAHPGPAPVVVDAGDIAPLWTGPSGGTARLLLTNPRPAPVEVWRWRLYPGERHDSHAHPPGVTETLTVVRGQMLLTLADTACPLHAGQTTAFASDVPHSYQGAGRGPCELIMTVHLTPEHHGA